MKRTFLTALVFDLVLISRGFAALGQNENEIQNLFGPPFRQSPPDKKGIITNLYNKGNYVILVQFLNHLSLAESYSRTDKRELSQKEIDAFLEGSSNGRPWLKDPTNEQGWVRADRKAKAWCQTTKAGLPTLLVEVQ